MKGSDVFHLNICKERFERIMKLEPKKRLKPAQILMEDMEVIFGIPYTVDITWEKNHPEVLALYEKVNMEAV